MKVQILLPISIAVSVASFTFMKIRFKEVATENKRAKFQDVKLRVTTDVLKEYEKEMHDTESLMENEKKQQDELQKALSSLNTDAKKGELDSCRGIKKTTTDEIASLEEQLKKLQDDSTKEKTDWEAEVAALKQKLDAPSPICNYIKPGSVQELCPKKEEKKPEAPKQDEPKPEAPKQEEPKPKAPKQEEPKPEAPKQEEPKPEAPKQEEPKPEAPKQEEPKPEAPKKEEPKPEAPKQEEPKPEAPKKEEPKPEAPKK